MRLALLSPADRLVWWAVRTLPGGCGGIAFIRGVWHSICDRLAEWVLTAWLLILGVTLSGGGGFNAPADAVLGSWADNGTWSLVCLIGGGCRLMLLIANGGWRKSPHCRVFAALGSIPLWVSLADSCQLAGSGTIGSGAYYVCVFAELVSMYRATREAGWNDGRAAHQENRG